MMMQDVLGLNSPRSLPLFKGAFKPPEEAASFYLLKGCKTGVELEFEDCQVTEADMINMRVYGWTGKAEGSLRGDGWEWVFHYPLDDTNVVTAVYYALDLAIKRHYSISVRTGLHTHVNVLDMEVRAYKMMLLLYAFLEPAIYRYVADDRDENVHCVPWYAASDGLKAVSSIYNTAEEKIGLVLPGMDQRYGGLNLAATKRFGSVEWRHLKATMDPHRIMQWISMNHRLKEASIRMASMDVVAMAMSSPEGFIRTILQDQTGILWYDGIVKECMDLGLKTMLDIICRQASRYHAQMDWDSPQFSVGENPSLKKFMSVRAPKPALDNVYMDDLRQALNRPVVAAEDRPAERVFNRQWAAAGLAIPPPNRFEFRIEEPADQVENQMQRAMEEIRRRAREAQAVDAGRRAARRVRIPPLDVNAFAQVQPQMIVVDDYRDEVDIMEGDGAP